MPEARKISTGIQHTHGRRKRTGDFEFTNKIAHTRFKIIVDVTTTQSHLSKKRLYDIASSWENFQLGIFMNILQNFSGFCITP